MKLVLIPPGEFDMGSTPEEIAAEAETVPAAYRSLFHGEAPRHRVKITKSFYMAVFLVTQSEYERIAGVNPSAYTARQMDASQFNPPISGRGREFRGRMANRMSGKDTSRHPVETVSWDDATEFCRRLSAAPAERAAGRVYRLPTEAEWEYACRAGTTTRWFFGNDSARLGDYAWTISNCQGTTHPVGEKGKNSWGLYDICGNVCQWCADWIDGAYYRQSPPNDPRGPASGSFRVWRGGSWGGQAFHCGSAFRLSGPPDTRNLNNGFRVVAVDR
jgi:formylglycine-generating enzyme required for sulfatase activity